MINIIVELLEKNERVIIPGFGAFLRKKDTTVISFNEYLKFNDGIIINCIIENENLEKPVAEEKLDKYVAEILQTIDSGSDYYFEGIGVVSKNEKGKFIFVQGNVSEIPVGKKEHNEQIPETQPEEKQKDHVKEESLQAIEDTPGELEEQADIQPDEDIQESQKPAQEEKQEVTEIQTEKETETKPEDQQAKEKQVEERTEPEVVKVSLEEIAKKMKARANEKPQESEKKATPVKKENKKKIEKPPKPPKNKEQKDKGDKKSKWWLWLIIVFVVFAAGAFGFAIIKPEVVCGWGINISFLKCDQHQITDTIIESKKINEQSDIHKQAIDVETTKVDKNTAKSDSATIDSTVIDSLTADTVVENNSENTEPDIINDQQETIETQEADNAQVQETAEPTNTSQKNQDISGHKFYVVAGCFQIEANANKFVEELKGKGYTNARIFGNIGYLYGVCYDFFDNRQDALNLITKTGDRAWIIYY